MAKFTAEQRERIQSIRTIPTRGARPVYGVRPDGERTKAVTDELGNTVTHHSDGRQDVLIRAPQIKLTQQEAR